MSFSNRFFQIQQEGYIARSCICIGLTEMRRAQLGERGRYYVAFYQLTTAFERLSKLALILEYMVSHRLNVPGTGAVRNYGHNLVTLFEKAGKIAEARQYDFTEEFDLPPLRRRILSFLSDFASGMRYANLDALASGSAKADPLSTWNDIMRVVIDSEVSATKKKAIARDTLFLNHFLSESATVVAHDLENRPLSLLTSLSEPWLQTEGSRYVVWHLVLLLSPLKKLVCTLSDEARPINLDQEPAIQHIPDMNDFFSFLWVDRTYVLRKKNWP